MPRYQGRPLGFTASRLQDRADYLKKLADCEDITEAVKYQMKLAQQSWSRCFGEALSVFDHLRTYAEIAASSSKSSSKGGPEGRGVIMEDPAETTKRTDVCLLARGMWISSDDGT